MGIHAVDDGVIQHLSASQIGTFIQCPRLWFYEKKLRIPPPPEQDRTALETGTSMHSEHEDYFNDNVTPKHGSLRRLIAHPRWPRRSKHLLIEHPRSYMLGITAAGVNLKGRIDLLDGSDLTSPLVCDLKSMSTFRYALNAEALSRDTQLTIYGKYVFTVFPQAQSVRYAHGQALSKGEDARVVMTDPLSREHVDQVFESIEAVAARMVQTALLTDPADVPGDETGVRCRKFKGCPYLSICPKFAHERDEDPWADFDSTPTPQPGETNMTLKERLAAKNTVGAGSAINPPDAAKPAPVTKYVPPSKAELGEEIVDAPKIETAAQLEYVLATGTLPPTSSPPSSTAPEGLVLFINCSPSRAPGTRLEDMIAERSKPILAKHPGLVDVRQIKYAEGKNALVAEFLKDPPSGYVFASSAGLSGEVLDVLIPLADEVVRGH